MFNLKDVFLLCAMMSSNYLFNVICTSELWKKNFKKINLGY